MSDSQSDENNIRYPNLYFDKIACFTLSSNMFCTTPAGCGCHNWPRLWQHSRQHGRQIHLTSYLYARTAKVLSLWIKLRTMLTSCGWDSCRGSVCPGIRIIITCGRTGITWQLSSSCRVLPWNSSISAPRYYSRTHRVKTDTQYTLTDSE